MNKGLSWRELERMAEPYYDGRDELFSLCHCEGGPPTAAIQEKRMMDRHVASLLAMTNKKVSSFTFRTSRRSFELSRRQRVLYGAYGQ